MSTLKPASINRRQFAVGLTSLAALGLTACGGGGDEDTDQGAAAPDPNFELLPNARVLDSRNAELIAQDATSMTLAGAAVQTVAAGDVIVSTLGGGALRRVLTVQRLPNGHARLGTEEAALVDAFRRFNLGFARELTGVDLGADFDTGDPGLELKWVPGGSAKAQGPEQGNARAQEVSAGSFELRFKDWVLEGTGMSIDGKASFRMQPEFDVALVDVPGSALPAVTYRAGLAPAYSHELTLASSFGGGLSRSVSREVPLRPIVVASPPVVIVPYVVVSASVSGTAAGKFSTTHIASISGSARVWRDADGVGDASHSFVPLQRGTFDSVEAAVQAAFVPARVSLEFRLYNVAGPQFALSARGTAKGAFERNGVAGQEGIRATVDGSLQARVSVGGSLGFVTRLFSSASGDFELIGRDFDLGSGELFDAFFPFTGTASVVVRDNGNVPDDIFEVALDGQVLGRTSKGGSGQFRIGSLAPGPHTLRLLTVEDDAPPGTWQVVLANGLTFASGGTARSGSLALGSAVDLPVVVPPSP